MKTTLEYFLWKARDFMIGWNLLVEHAGKVAIESRASSLSMESGLPKHVIIAMWVYLSV